MAKHKDPAEQVLNADIEPYQRLRVAIMKQAITDYRKVIRGGYITEEGSRCTVQALEAFFFSRWGLLLAGDIDIRAAIRREKENAEAGRA